MDHSNIGLRLHKGSVPLEIMESSTKWEELCLIPLSAVEIYLSAKCDNPCWHHQVRFYNIPDVLVVVPSNKLYKRITLILELVGPDLPKH